MMLRPRPRLGRRLWWRAARSPTRSSWRPPGRWPWTWRRRCSSCRVSGRMPAFGPGCLPLRRRLVHAGAGRAGCRGLPTCGASLPARPPPCSGAPRAQGAAGRHCGGAGRLPAQGPRAGGAAAAGRGRLLGGLGPAAGRPRGLAVLPGASALGPADPQPSQLLPDTCRPAHSALTPAHCPPPRRAQDALPYLVRERDGRLWLLPTRGGPQVLATCHALARLYEVVHHLTLPLVGEPRPPALLPARLPGCPRAAPPAAAPWLRTRVPTGQARSARPFRLSQCRPLTRPPLALPPQARAARRPRWRSAWTR
jgi:hypothetical protein